MTKSLKETLHGHAERHGIDSTIDLMIAETNILNAEIAALKAERDAALAACAEMRAALEGVLSEHEARVGECNCGICYPIHALLKKGGG